MGIRIHSHHPRMTTATFNCSAILGPAVMDGGHGESNWPRPSTQQIPAASGVTQWKHIVMERDTLNTFHPFSWSFWVAILQKWGKRDPKKQTSMDIQLGMLNLSGCTAKQHGNQRTKLCLLPSSWNCSTGKVAEPSRGNSSAALARIWPRFGDF